MDQIKRIGLKLLMMMLASAVALAAAAVILWSVRSAENRLKTQLDLGGGYLEEMNYEQAAAAYEQALAIDPKCAEAYLGLAEVYAVSGEPQKALEILGEGYDITQSGQVRERLMQLQEEQAHRSE